MKAQESFSINFALDFLSATEQAAIAASRWIGKGNGKAADKAAVDAMRNAFNKIDFSGEIVIGEGAKDEAPELFVGEKLGTGRGVLVDIAVDPLECTDSVAYGRPNALAVIAMGPRSSLYKAFDGYMEKIAVGPEARGVVDFDMPVKTAIKKVAHALGKEVGEVTVAVLDRPRHEDLIRQIRQTGARVRLFSDGDVAMAIATCLPESPIDMLFGTGGSTEAVLAAAALRCLGGEIMCRWKPSDERQRVALQKLGARDAKKIFFTSDLANSDYITFTATGVIDGPLADGVVCEGQSIITHSVVMSLQPRMLRFIKTKHILEM
ncbi:MAG: fructose-bisphosphatase, class II [Candidatus Ryanbacteria bacterium RIFCSPHIGHO2_02_FULL_45_13b]|uniref:Fructose-1,6-bisphosphatase n=1 Tax=Candidatus Ryanbacteria bacterium RIFCSPHIGHO2_02_FULL_45_13b TaxID=1802117 RepID=A0A1G2G3P1_9BACT|nr:MAG: fructose-bisphosphatase, class II [Candidatus Ryanbacteria bacterium RIFCSPHIGHO2_02_FULL_45_13b]